MLVENLAVFPYSRFMIRYIISSRKFGREGGQGTIFMHKEMMSGRGQGSAKRKLGPSPAAPEHGPRPRAKNDVFTPRCGGGAK